jgi:signal recognition particle receptor subunit beta
MPLLNNLKREITCKLVYYGPGACGKTTNLKYIHSQLAPATRGEMTSMATQTDRTLFFDFMPLDLGSVHGWKIRVSVYTVPGQVEYNASRKLILQGADGLVFVADSDFLRAPDNIESLQNLRSNLASLDTNLEQLPWIVQLNKRDLDNPMPVERMVQDMNIDGLPTFEAVATEGVGVFQTLKSISKLMMNDLSKVLK